MKKVLLSFLTIFLVSAIYAQLDDQPLLLHLDFEDEDDIALNDQDMAYDEAEPTAEYSTDAKIGTGAASFDGLQYIIMDLNDGVLSAQANNSRGHPGQELQQKATDLSRMKRQETILIWLRSRPSSGDLSQALPLLTWVGLTFSRWKQK